MSDCICDPCNHSNEFSGSLVTNKGLEIYPGTRNTIGKLTGCKNQNYLGLSKDGSGFHINKNGELIDATLLLDNFFINVNTYSKNIISLKPNEIYDYTLNPKTNFIIIYPNYTIDGRLISNQKTWYLKYRFINREMELNIPCDCVPTVQLSIPPCIQIAGQTLSPVQPNINTNTNLCCPDSETLTRNATLDIKNFNLTQISEYKKWNVLNRILVTDLPQGFFQKIRFHNYYFISDLEIQILEIEKK